LVWHAGITAFEVVVGFVLGSLRGAAIGYALQLHAPGARTLGEALGAVHPTRNHPDHESSSAVSTLDGPARFARALPRP
jgi:hypothetical protein